MENKTVNDTSLVPMSDKEITHYLPDTRILKYSDLADFNSIAEVLPNTRDAVILLTQQVEGFGHWLCLLRHNKTIVFFDPFGNRVDKSLEWTKKQVRKSVGQDIPHLSLLLNEALDEGYKVIFSETEFQNKEKNLSTCGRWVISIITYWLAAKRPSLKGFYNIIMKLVNKFELIPDLVVSKLFP